MQTSLWVWGGKEEVRGFQGLSGGCHWKSPQRVGRGTERLRMTFNRWCRILGYRGMRGYDRSRPISTAVKYEGRSASALDKCCWLAEARANKSKREAEEFRSNLKSRAEVEGGGCMEVGLREAPREGGGGGRHGGRGGYLSCDVVQVWRHKPMRGGKGKRLILRQLSPLELVMLFTRMWWSEEQEAGQNGAQEPTRGEYEIR